MSYVFQPYPKMIYRNGDQRVVADYAEEVSANKDGWGNGPAWVWPQPVVSEPVVAAAADTVSVPSVDVESHVPPVEVPPVDTPPPVVKRGPGRPRKRPA